MYVLKKFLIDSCMWLSQCLSPLSPHEWNESCKLEKFAFLFYPLQCVCVCMCMHTCTGTALHPIFLLSKTCSLITWPYLSLRIMSPFSFHPLHRLKEWGVKRLKNLAQDPQTTQHLSYRTVRKAHSGPWQRPDCHGRESWRSWLKGSGRLTCNGETEDKFGFH